jgi:hypothetical protein
MHPHGRGSNELIMNSVMFNYNKTHTGFTTNPMRIHTMRTVSGLWLKIEYKEKEF